jgi:hypothetical protein
MNPNIARTMSALRLSVLSTLQSPLTRRGPRVVLHRGRFQVKIPLRNLRALFLLWKFLSCEVHHQVALLSVQPGTIHTRILVPKRDIASAMTTGESPVHHALQLSMDACPPPPNRLFISSTLFFL